MLELRISGWPFFLGKRARQDRAMIDSPSMCESRNRQRKKVHTFWMIFLLLMVICHCPVGSTEAKGYVLGLHKLRCYAAHFVAIPNDLTMNRSITAPKP